MTVLLQHSFWARLSSWDTFRITSLFEIIFGLDSTQMNVSPCFQKLETNLAYLRRHYLGAPWSWKATWVMPSRLSLTDCTRLSVRAGGNHLHQRVKQHLSTDGHGNLTRFWRASSQTLPISLHLTRLWSLINRDRIWFVHVSFLWYLFSNQLSELGLLCITLE